MNLDEQINLFWQKYLVFCPFRSFSISLKHPFSIDCTQHCPTYVGQFWSSQRLLSNHWKLSIWQIISPVRLVFAISANFCNLAVIGIGLSGEVFEVVEPTWWSPKSDFHLVKWLLLSAMFQLIKNWVRNKCFKDNSFHWFHKSSQMDWLVTTLFYTELISTSRYKNLSSFFRQDKLLE